MRERKNKAKQREERKKEEDKRPIKKTRQRRPIKGNLFTCEGEIKAEEEGR